MELSNNDIRTLRDVANWFRANRHTLKLPQPVSRSKMIGLTKMEIGKADADIAADGTGTISIWRDGADTGDNIEDVELDWMHGGTKVSLGKEVLIAYFPKEQKWRIIGAECE